MPLNKTQLIEKLTEIKKRMDSQLDGDTYYYEESGHEDADAALLEYIGDKEIAEAYHEINK